MAGKVKTKTGKGKEATGPVVIDDSLSPQQRVFCFEYVKSWNGTQAAKLAGYSEHTAAEQAYRLLRNVHIQKFIRDHVATVAMSADEVLLRLARHARGTFEPFIYSGEMLPGEAPKLNLSTEAAQQNIDLVKQIETETTTRIVEDEAYETVKIKVRLHDAQSALEKLGRYHGLFTDKIEHKGNVRIVVEYADDTAPTSQAV